MTWGVHITLAPRWLDPAETEGIITPFMVLYGLHDALVKPMPAGLNTPSLAESWTESKDGLTYEFTLRKGSPTPMVAGSRTRRSGARCSRLR
jgi:peptide/nickel transport system substrate-binding protein